jgi:hypothetical protein
VPQELLHNMWQQPRRAECSGKALPRGMHCIVALCACTGLTYTQAPIYPIGVCCCRPTCVQRTSLTSSGSTRPAGRARQLGTVCCAMMHDAWCGTPMAHQVHLHWAHPQCCWAVCCILILNVNHKASSVPMSARTMHASRPTPSLLPPLQNPKTPAFHRSHVPPSLPTR